MKMLKTNYGIIEGVTNFETFGNGRVKTLTVNKENRLETDYGILIPSYREVDITSERTKKHKSSITFYDNGLIKSLPLERETMIETPLGEFPAELLTFYDTGELHRIFPLNGQVNGFWREDDEKALAISYTFDIGYGRFTAKVIGLRFYPSGALRGMTFWPDESVVIDSPIGEIAVRIGLSFYENGSLESLEPEAPMYINTPIGYIQAYDEDAIGIHGDANSLKFTESGELLSLKTVHNGVIVTLEDGKKRTIEPREVPSYVDMNETMIIPLEISFVGTDVIIAHEVKEVFSKKTNKFRVIDSSSILSACGSGCSSCSGCGH